MGHVWDDYCQQKLVRVDANGMSEVLDPGVNYFVLALEKMGATTLFSCEGHPLGFYVTFVAPYTTALQVAEIGEMNEGVYLRLIGQDRWLLVMELWPDAPRQQNEFARVTCLRGLAERWEAWFKSHGVH